MATTAQTSTETPVLRANRTAVPGGAFVWAGLCLAVLVVLTFVFVQIGWAMWLVTPWYLPIGGTAAVLLVLGALAQRRTWGRIGIAAVCMALALMEWHFVLMLSVLPAYAGPLKAGLEVPAFHARLADGTEISKSYFQQNPNTVVVFFQGRWCPFCMTQLRELEAHHAEFDRVKAKVLVVSIEGAKLVAQTQREFPHLVVVSDEKRELSNAAELINIGKAPDGGDADIPTILIVDQTGTVRWLHRPASFVARPSAAELATVIESQTAR